MKSNALCLILLILLSSANSFLYSQNAGCPTSLKIAVELEKIKPDSIIIDLNKDGLSSRIIGPTMRLKAVNSNVRIISFICTTENDDGDVIEVKNEGEYLSTLIFQMISNRKKSSIIYFECIKAVSKEGRIFIVEPFILRI